MSKPEISLVKLEKPSKKEVKELLQEWLDNDDLEEIVLLGKIKGKFRWDHSGLDSTFWWIGFLNHIASLLSRYQDEDG